MNWGTTMSPPETSTVGSLVGSGVGPYDVFHWGGYWLPIANSLAALGQPYFYFYLISTNTR
jgi:hypothetical protein